jgi:hypothetical protein
VIEVNAFRALRSPRRTLVNYSTLLETHVLILPCDLASSRLEEYSYITDGRGGLLTFCFPSKVQGNQRPFNC